MESRCDPSSPRYSRFLIPEGGIQTGPTSGRPTPVGGCNQAPQDETAAHTLPGWILPMNRDSRPRRHLCQRRRAPFWVTLGRLWPVWGRAVTVPARTTEAQCGQKTRTRGRKRTPERAIPKVPRPLWGATEPQLEASNFPELWFSNLLGRWPTPCAKQNLARGGSYVGPWEQVRAVWRQHPQRLQPNGTPRGVARRPWTVRCAPLGAGEWLPIRWTKRKGPQQHPPTRVAPLPPFGQPDTCGRSGPGPGPAVPKGRAVTNVWKC